MKSVQLLLLLSEWYCTLFLRLNSVLCYMYLFNKQYFFQPLLLLSQRGLSLYPLITNLGSCFNKLVNGYSFNFYFFTGDRYSNSFVVFGYFFEIRTLAFSVNSFSTLACSSITLIDTAGSFLLFSMIFHLAKNQSYLMENRANRNKYNMLVVRIASD